MEKFYIILTLLVLCATVTLAQSHTVEIVNSEFIPADITVQEGDTVLWVNEGTLVHTTTSGVNCTSDGIWDSGGMSPSEEFAYIFSNAGDYPYYCQPHCAAGMTGSVTVESTSSDISLSKAEIKAYPNPVVNRLQITVPNDQNNEYQIILMNVKGEKVAEIVNYHSQSYYEMDLSKLSPGIYFVHIIADAKDHYIKRIMKIDQ